MEFGSDFHSLDYPKGGKTLLEYFPKSNLYTSGRQALLDLTLTRGWKRLWVPSYFCEDTLNCIPRAGIELCHYNITPLDDPMDVIPSIPVTRDDGMLIVNYFGLFNKRDFLNIECEIVEDHTHSLIGSWAVNSSADWCIASLRKTLPISDGGILWSPKNHMLPDKPMPNEIIEKVMVYRETAMNLKRSYLSGGCVNKGEFLKIFSETEEKFDNLPISRISNGSFQILDNIDIRTFFSSKHRNWSFLYESLNNDQVIKILLPENSEDCPFSFTVLFKDKDTRNRVRKLLISKSVYPAILWNIKNNADESAIDFGDRMLSMHCDSRYSLKDMECLIAIIKDSLI